MVERGAIAALLLCLPAVACNGDSGWAGRARTGSSATLVATSGERLVATPRGASVALVGGATVGLELVAVGRGRASPRLPPAEVTRLDGAVNLTRTPRVQEWWRGSDQGLEHGLTLSERPVGRGPLTATVAVRGLSPRTLSDDAIALVAADGASRATYTHLAVVDARGRRLPAGMHADDDRIVITIDDGAASYPIVVDPLLATEESVFRGAAGTVYGTAVALSADGARAVVADSGGVTGAGAVYVFRRTGTLWSMEITLVGADIRGGESFGQAVAISHDGTRVLIGVPGDETALGVRPGSARVFALRDGSWGAEATLVTAVRGFNDFLGTAVALSADGSVALVGAPVSDVAGMDTGSAHVFTRTDTTWSETATLVSPSPARLDRFGSAVALGADGTLAFVGASLERDAVGDPSFHFGSVYVFELAGGSWTPIARLGALGATAEAMFGSSIDVSADGSILVVGAPGDTVAGFARAGTARVFVRDAAGWTETATLSDPDPSERAAFGEEISLSDDGTRALAGSVRTGRDEGPDGARRGVVFDRTAAGWEHQLTLTTTDRFFGADVALSGDGRRALIGAPLANLARLYVLRGTEGTPCMDDDACSTGRCVAGTCMSCAADAECSGAAVCRAGRCEPPPLADAGPPLADASTPADASPGTDAAIAPDGSPGVDAAMSEDAGGDMTTDAGETPPPSRGGCACTIAATSRAVPASWARIDLAAGALALLAGLAWARRRTERRPARAGRRVLRSSTSGARPGGRS